MLHHSFRAMNTDCPLILRFLPDSDLSRLNEGPSDRAQMSAEVAALLARALGYPRVTGSVFDPLMLGELEALGYDRTFEEVSRPPQARHPVTRRRAGWALAQVDARRGVVTRPSGARIDLGGVAKGAAAYRLLQVAGLQPVRARESRAGDLGRVRVARVASPAQVAASSASIRHQTRTAN
jgi:thiamine biosynthesis lipoprotein ApbE